MQLETTKTAFKCVLNTNTILMQCKCIMLIGPLFKNPADMLSCLHTLLHIKSSLQYKQKG